MSDQNNVILGAIFHDIGKFAQRANMSEHKDPNEQVYCKSYKGQYFTHQHTLYTAGFLNELNQRQYFNTIGRAEDNIKPNVIHNLASKHHVPEDETPLTWLIAEADRLSSGIDRSEKEITEYQKNYKKQPLRLIFDKVHLKSKYDKDHYHDLTVLEPTNSFPKENIHLNEEKYRKIWNEFEKELVSLQAQDIRSYYLKLDSVLERYTWAIPSSTMDEPDISLYDHLYTSAAIAAVLYSYHSSNDTIEKDSIIQKDSPKFIFVSGDLSGIQSYIFDLHSTKNASKLLRARSFELQALSENISDSLLERFQLPHFCRIINAGGKFTVLLPNIPQVQDELQKFRKELDHYFIQKYHGQITFNLSEGVEACGRDFDQSKSISLFRSISLDSARAKQKKLQTVLMSQADHVLDKDYDKIQETAGICDQCRERPGFHEIDETLFCHSCKDLFQFGGELPKAKFMRISQNKTKNALNLFDGKILEVLREKTSSEDSLVSLHNYHSGLALKHSSSYIPSEGNKILTMEEIGARSTGMDHIAMFKADLDNLGGIFSIGMKEKTSLSRYSSMSRMLNYFFSDYLHHMIEKSEKYKDIYIVFSGGDDLCLIGPWNIVIDFAAEFQKEFERFVGKNPNLTISGGIALASNKLPVKSLAQMTEELLDKSKDKDMKNSITLFGKTISWIRLRELLKESDKLMTQVFRNQKNSKEGLSKGLVYRLLNYSKKAQAMTDGDFRGDIPLWKSHLSYDISRNVYEEELRKELLSQLTKEEVINDMPVAVSHVLYQLRDRKNGGHKNED